MKQKDLIRIKDDGSLYELTDGIYQYKLRAHTSSVDGEVFWSITCHNNGTHACFWKHSRISTQDDFLYRKYYVKFTIISLKSLVTVGGGCPFMAMMVLDQ